MLRISRRIAPASSLSSYMRPLCSCLPSSAGASSLPLSSTVRRLMNGAGAGGPSSRTKVNNGSSMRMATTEEVKINPARRKAEPRPDGFTPIVAHPETPLAAAKKKQAQRELLAEKKGVSGRGEVAGTGGKLSQSSPLPPRLSASGSRHFDPQSEEAMNAFAKMNAVSRGQDVDQNTKNAKDMSDEEKEEALQSLVDKEIENVRSRHLNVEGWGTGGARQLGRVVDINPSDPPLSLRRRAHAVAEFALEMPLLLAEFGQMRGSGFSDDGADIKVAYLLTPPPLPNTATEEEKQTHKLKMADHAAYKKACEWIDIADLSSLRKLQNARPPPEEEAIEEAMEQERLSQPAHIRGNALRHRYCALVSHTTWIWSRLALVIDCPSNWDFPDELRFRWISEQLQVAYLSALQALAFFSKHQLHLATVPSADDGMVRACWLVLGHACSRQSHLQDEAMQIWEHLAEWRDEDIREGISNPGIADQGVVKELAAVHAFCGRWTESVAAEQLYIRDCGARVRRWARSVEENNAGTVPDYQLQQYCDEAQRSLTRISYALLQQEELSPEDKEKLLQFQKSGSPPSDDTPLPHMRDVLGSVHAAQFAVGLAWRRANMLNSSAQLMYTLAEAHALSNEDTKLAEEIKKSAARYARELTDQLERQHSVDPSEEDRDPKALLETAIMQAHRFPQLRTGIAAFLHFMDELTPDKFEPTLQATDIENKDKKETESDKKETDATAAADKDKKDPSAPPAESATTPSGVTATGPSIASTHQWCLQGLQVRLDAACAYQQLAISLQAWAEEEWQNAALIAQGQTGMPDALTKEQVEELQRCVTEAYASAQVLARIAPSLKASQRADEFMGVIGQRHVDDFINEKILKGKPELIKERMQRKAHVIEGGESKQTQTEDAGGPTSADRAVQPASPKTSKKI